MFRRHAGIALEVFPEERDVREIEGVGYFLNRHLAGTQLGLGVVNDQRGDDFGQCLAGYLLDGGTQMLGRQVQLVCIERDVSFMPVILYGHTEQFPHNFMVSAVATIGLYLRNDGLP